MTPLWKPSPLGEVLQERQEVPPALSIETGAIRIISKIVFESGKIEFRVGTETRTKMITIQPGDLVLSGINAAKGAIALYPENETAPAAATIHYSAYKVNEDKADKHFLWWLLRSNTFREILARNLPGGIKTELKAKRLLPIKIPLPPLPEQRRIVAKIERLAGRIEEARRVKRYAEKGADGFLTSCRAAKMAECLENGQKPITEAILFERGKFSHRPRNDPRFFGGTHPWIQIGEIEAAHKYITKWNQTLNDEGLSISRKFPKGSVLISIAATIGAVGILKFDCCIPDSIVAATPKSGTDSEFVYHYLGFLRTHLEEVAPQSAQKNINLKILSALPFPDISQSKQKQIAEYLDSIQAKVDRLKALQAKTSTELDALLPSILDKAFKGEL